MGHNSDSGVARTGVPKLSLAMYLFSVWIDEHVPLNVGTGSIFSREGPIMDIQRLGQKYFAGGTEVAKSHFDHSKLENNFFAKNVDEKMSNFKILEGPCPLLQTPMLLKYLLTKKLRKISKIYLSIST